MMEDNMPATTLTCFDVANYFLSLTDEDSGDSITNLKLQKLVYFAQGFYIGLYRRPLFNESIEAWQHGPVIPDLYQQYKDYGSGCIPSPKIDITLYSVKIKDLLDEVYKVFGQYSAWKLRALSHEGSPWKNAFNRRGDNTITVADMEEYFKPLIKEA
jgi:uncharacterized phage-associated protein